MSQRPGGDSGRWPSPCPASPSTGGWTTGRRRCPSTRSEGNTNAYGETDISGADLDASADFSPSFRVGYSLEEQRIYVAVEVLDDRLHVSETGHQDTDALELYLAARPGAVPVYYLICPPGGGYGPGRPNPSVLVSGAGELPLDRSGSRGAVSREGGVTVYEWALQPLGDSLEDVVELRPGITLGFDVAAVDRDGSDDTAAWVSWTPPTRKFSGGGRIGGLVLARAGGDLGSVAVQVEDEGGEALAICSRGDTVQLAPGTYDQPLELIGHVTILGAGHDRTRVAGEAHWGLALRPFITYYEHRGEDLWAVHRPGVAMAGFTLDGGGDYPDRTAEEVSDLLAVVNAIGHRTLGTYATAEDAATVRDLLEARRGPRHAPAQALWLLPPAEAPGATSGRTAFAVPLSGHHRRRPSRRLARRICRSTCRARSPTPTAPPT